MTTGGLYEGQARACRRTGRALSAPGLGLTLAGLAVFAAMLRHVCRWALLDECDQDLRRTS